MSKYIIEIPNDYLFRPYDVYYPDERHDPMPIWPCVPAELDYVEDKSRYAELFGTPERAARTMAVNCYEATSDACDTCFCDDCDGTLYNKPVLSDVYDALLEWLKGDAE